MVKQRLHYLGQELLWEISTVEVKAINVLTRYMQNLLWKCKNRICKLSSFFMLHHLCWDVQIADSFPYDAGDRDLFIPISQYHGFWCLGDTRSQGISSHGIDLVLQECSTIDTRIIIIQSSKDSYNYVHYKIIITAYAGYKKQTFLGIDLQKPNQQIHSWIDVLAAI